MWPAAVLTTARWVDCWNCRFGCSITRLARLYGSRRSPGWTSPRFRRCGHYSMRRRSAALRLGSHHRMCLIREQQGSLTTRIGEKSMRRQRQLRHDDPSGTQQFDLFDTAGSSRGDKADEPGVRRQMSAAWISSSRRWCSAAPSGSSSSTRLLTLHARHCEELRSLPRASILITSAPRSASSRPASQPSRSVASTIKTSGSSISAVSGRCVRANAPSPTCASARSRCPSC